jgi:uncharacterized membrane protein YfcA
VFVSIEQAVAMTALVHLVNGLFKFALVARHTRWRIVLVFGLPAVAASVLGAWLLLRVADAAPLLNYTVGDAGFEVTPVKLLVGLLLGAFVLVEVLPAFRRLQFAPRLLPVGGVLSGFFGGLAGMQGALRSAFLLRAGLTKEQFVGTGAAIACLIDVSRLGVYLPAIRQVQLDLALLTVAMLAGVAGAILGSLWLHKISVRAVERLVAALLLMFAVGLVSGAI